MYLDHFSDFVIQNRNWVGEERGREGSIFSPQSELNLTREARPGLQDFPAKPEYLVLVERINNKQALALVLIRVEIKL